MPKRIHLNAFAMNCAGHQSPGLWAHPRDQSWRYKDLAYWQEVGRTLERGIFDGIFIADVIGYYDVYRNSLYHALEQGVQIPVNDPLQLVGPIALATKHLGIGVTSSTSFEHPYSFARRLATADHHSGGRMGWNIVTSFLESGAKNLGQSGLNHHDNRYEIAEEYMEVLYKLLEGSWEDGAVVCNRDKRIFAHPEKIHAIGHRGKHFEVPGYHMSEPSPQRTPVLYQAGASGPGRQFAARHAECVFVAFPTKALVQAYVADLRRRVALAGRDPHKILTYNHGTVIVAETDAAAKAKFEEYQKYASYDGALVLMSGWSGVDFGQYAPTELVKRVKTNAVVSMMQQLMERDKPWTIDELALWGGIGGIGPVFVGSPSTIADILQEWIEETDLDGFNLSYAVTPETFEDIVSLLVPELQRRGVYPTAYGPGTLRQQLFGEGAYLPPSHPAHRYRHLQDAKIHPQVAPGGRVEYSRVKGESSSRFLAPAPEESAAIRPPVD